MPEQIEPVNIASAAVIAQLSLLAIMALGALIIRRTDRDAQLWGGPTFGSVFVVLVVLAIVSIGALVTSDALTDMWSPLLRPPLPALLSWSTALSLVFFLDIGVVTYLVVETSGGRYSPFVALFFLLPTLAVFLREPTRYVVIYLITATAGYTAAVVLPFRQPALPDVETRWRFSEWLVAVASAILAVVIGLLTRQP